jgi:hypothetical protein
MAIETICQGCSKKLRVADEHAGKQARCPACGMIYTVPNPTISSFTLLDEAQAPIAAPLPSQAFANSPAKTVSEQWLMKIDDGREFGPVDRATLDHWYAERRIGPTTQLKRQYDHQWQPASRVFPALATINIASPTTTAAANPFAEQSAAPMFTPSTGRAPAAYVEPHRGALVLILALLSWFVNCFPLGIAAWVMASGDLHKMRIGQMDRSGEGLTRASMIIAIIHVGLSALALLLLLMIVVLGIVAG